MRILPYVIEASAGSDGQALQEVEEVVSDYPTLDAIEADFLGVYVHLWATISYLDESTPVGRPLARACRVCAGSTVRMRQAVTKAIGGRKVERAWVCQHCDMADSGMRVPRGWSVLLEENR